MELKKGSAEALVKKPIKSKKYTTGALQSALKMKGIK